MKNTRAIAVFVAFALLFGGLFATGCLSERATINSAGMPVVWRVLQRHDAYVAADQTLSELARAAALHESGQVAEAFKQPTVAIDLLRAPVNAVCDRHDAYVAADPALSPVKREAYADSAWMIREAFKPR